MVEVLGIGAGDALGLSVVEASKLVLRVDSESFVKAFGFNEDKGEEAIDEEVVDLDGVATDVKTEVVEDHVVVGGMGLQSYLIGYVFFGGPTGFAFADFGFEVSAL